MADTTSIPDPVMKLVRIVAKPGAMAPLKETLKTLEAATVLEIGCVEFSLYQGISDESAFVLLEHFVSQQAFSDHMKMPHTKAFFQAALVESVHATDVPSLGTR